MASRRTLRTIVALVVVATTACRPATDPAVAGPTPAPTGTPDTPASAPPPAVVGVREPAAHWVSSTAMLTHETPAPAPANLVLPLAHAVGDWLDAHLDDLQRGGEGHLAEVADADLLAVADAADVTAVTTALTSASRPVASARYRLAGAYDTEVEWLTATVEVTGADGRTTAATLVFVPGDAGPRLVLFGPEARP